MSSVAATPPQHSLWCDSRATLEALKEVQQIGIQFPQLFKSLHSNHLLESLITHLQRHATLSHDNKGIALLCLSSLKEFASHPQLLADDGQPLLVTE